MSKEVNMRGQIWGLVFAAIVLGAVPKLARAEFQFIPFVVPGATNTFAHGINDAGQIAGGTTIGGFGGSNLGFVRDPAGNFTTFSVPGATSTFPFGINDAGQIVG